MKKLILLAALIIRALYASEPSVDYLVLEDEFIKGHQELEIEMEQYYGQKIKEVILRVQTDHFGQAAILANNVTIDVQPLIPKLHEYRFELEKNNIIVGKNLESLKIQSQQNLWIQQIQIKAE